jgi:hypothetical protein
LDERLALLNFSVGAREDVSRHGEFEYSSVTVGVTSDLRVSAVALTTNTGLFPIPKGNLESAARAFSPPRRRWLINCSALSEAEVRDAVVAAVIFGQGYSCQVLQAMALAVGMEMQRRLNEGGQESVVQVLISDLLYGRGGLKMESSALVVKLVLADDEEDSMVAIRAALGVRTGEIVDFRIPGFHDMPMAESVERSQAMSEPLKQSFLRPYKDFAVQISDRRDDASTLMRAVVAECTKANLAGQLAYAVFETRMGVAKLRIGFNNDVQGLVNSPEFCRKFHSPALMGSNGLPERYMDWWHAAKWYFDRKAAPRGGFQKQFHEALSSPWCHHENWRVEGHDWGERPRKPGGVGTPEAGRPSSPLRGAVRLGRCVDRILRQRREVAVPARRTRLA